MVCSLKLSIILFLSYVVEDIYVWTLVRACKDEDPRETHVNTNLKNKSTKWRT